MEMNRILADASSEARIIAAVADTPGLYAAAGHVAPDDFHGMEARDAWSRLTGDIRAGRPVFLSDYSIFTATVSDVVPLPEYVAEDARRIMVLSLARAALDCASGIARAAYGGDETAIRQALSRASEIAATRRGGTLAHIRSAIDELRAEMDDPEAGAARRVYTGIPPLDEKLGIERQTLTIVMARPSIGKTSLLAQISDMASERGQVVAVFSKEESRRQWARRAAFRRAGVSIVEFKAGQLSDDKLRRLSRELDAVHDRAALYVDSHAPQTTDDIAAECEAVRAEHGRLDMVIVDHIRHLADKADNEAHRLGRITWNLKIIAKRFDCAVIAAAQLSRGVEGQENKRPDLKDLRDSGEIEENADNVVGLYREKYYNPAADNVAELLIRKCREGERGAVVKTAFIEDRMSFERLQATNG